jgi:hypothetical protein
MTVIASTSLEIFSREMVRIDLLEERSVDHNSTAGIQFRRLAFVYVECYLIDDTGSQSEK